MDWIILVGITIFADAIAVYFDNYITDVFFKERHGIAQRLFYGCTYLLLAIILTIIFGINFTSIPPENFLMFIASGVLSSLAGIPYYRALECDDSTNLGIFFQFAPILYLIFNLIFFGVPISLFQLLSIPLILSAPALVIITAGKRSRGVHIKSMLLTLFSVCISVIGNLIFVNNNNTSVGFVDQIIPVFIGYGLSNVAMVLIIPQWRKRFFTVVKKHKQKVLTPMFGDAVFSVAKMVAYRAALVLAPSVALASTASDAIEPIAIFFVGIVLTLIWPKFGREKLTKKTVLTHLVSIILIAIGIILMQL